MFDELIMDGTLYQLIPHPSNGLHTPFNGE